jgi:hypothetical protein
MEELLGDFVIPEPSLAVPIMNSKRVATPHPRNKAGPNREQPWKDINMSSSEFPETFLEPGD